MATHQIPRINVEQRDKLGTRQSARLRTDGRLPAVIYGHQKDPLHVSADYKQFTDILHERAHLLEVVCGNQVEPCLVKEIQWNHLGSSILHVDLERVDLNERVTVEVDLELIGDPKGLKEAGSILERPVTTIEIECLASQIPDRITADISHLGVDEVLTVADLKLPEGVTTKLDADTILAAVHTVQEVVAPAAVEGEAPTEPKVIGKKTEEEEAEAAPAADKPAKAEKK